MAVHSTVPTVMAALSAAFVAAQGTSLLGVQIAESWPGGDTLKNSALFLGDVQSTDLHIPVSRSVRVVREENYTVDVHAQCAAPGASATPARTAVFAIYFAVEDILANNPTLGVDGVIKCIPSAYTMRTGLDDLGGWLAFMKLQLAVQARLL
jgi:hypothetical protein